MRSGDPGALSRQFGFTYMVVLAMCFVMGLGLASIGEMWQVAAQREKEKDLLFIGRQYRRALESYAAQSPGAPDLPRSLEELVEDKRFPTIKRHIRRVYADPMTGLPDWKLILQGDRILGIQSRSGGTPFKKTGFEANEDDFADAQTYAQWRFQYRQPAAVVAPGVVAPGGVPPPSGVTSGPVSPPVAAPVEAPPPPPPPPVKRNEERCETQRATDMQQCAAARDTGVTTGQIATCTASATSRFVACVGGRSLPALRLPAATTPPQ